jgi:hypothetical protein
LTPSMVVRLVSTSSTGESCIKTAIGRKTLGILHS